VIPCLLLKGQGLYKTQRFKDPSYVGDPINTLRIFNDKEVDEIVMLDIAASRERRGPPLRLIEDAASECFMPLAYGGGIRSLDDAKTVLNLGVEKIVINTAALDRPELITEIADSVGSSSVVVSIDARKALFGGYQVYGTAGTRAGRIDAVACATRAARLGAGEILVQSIDRDGTMKGYDLELVSSIARAVTVPVIACGGASSLTDLSRALAEGGASAVAAGSLFVYQGRHRAVLISYPSRQELASL
jgi:cyclase